MSDLSAGEIRQVQRMVSAAAWKLDLWKFAEAIGSNADHDYTKDKFREFQALSKALGRFDPETLVKVISAVSN